MAGNAGESGFRVAGETKAPAAPTETAKAGTRRRPTQGPAASASGAGRVATPAAPAAAAAASPSPSLPVERGPAVERVLRHRDAGQRGPATASGSAAAATLPTAAKGAAADGVRRRTKAQWPKAGQAGAAAAEVRGAAPATEAARELAAESAASVAKKATEAGAVTAPAGIEEDVGRRTAARARKTAAASRYAAADAAGSKARPTDAPASERPPAQAAAAADEGPRQRHPSAAALPRTRSLPASRREERGGQRAAGGAAAVAADVGTHEKRLCLKCSACGLGVEDVLLLSCHHHLCLLCAATAAQALEPPQALPQTADADDEGDSATARPRSRIDELSCPICGVSTVLSISATAALRQQLRFFENPPGCCFDAGPVGSATTPATAAARGRARQQAPCVALCSQCEQRAAAVYCRSCVRRFCGACAVAVHQDHPRLLTHPFQLLHQQQLQQQLLQQPRDSERRWSEGAAAADLLPPARAALQEAVRHMRTIDDRASVLSSILSSSQGSLAGWGEGRQGRERRTRQGRGAAGSDEREADSVHSSAIRLGFDEEGLQQREAAGEGRGGAGPLEGAALLHRLRRVLAAVPPSARRPLEAAAAAAGLGAAAASRGVSTELLRLRTVTNVACYAHASQPVEFFCCSCECYCVCAYCLTGFFPSGTAAAQAGAAATQLRSEDHTGHFLQAVDAAWTETVLPRIDEEWGGAPAAAAAAGESAAEGPAADAETEAGDGGRGILGQVRGELELLQQSFLQEKRREWARSLQQDTSTVETTSQLLLQRLNEKEQQLRTALEAFTVRFSTECDEARARLHHQTAELQETLRQLRMHKAALDPTVLLNYYREQRRRLEGLCAADIPKDYRQLPLSRKSVLQHAAQVTEELCGLAAELGANVRNADGSLFERLQRQQEQLKLAAGVGSPPQLTPYVR